MCLANKFSQLLISLYRSEGDKLSKILKGYPLEQIVYDFYVCYIIKESQTSNKNNKNQNLHLNEIWLLINNVLLPAINDQNVIDKLVIKILNNFILKSDSVYSQARVIESLESLPYSYDKVIAYAYDNLYQDDSKIKQSRDISQIFENLRESNTAHSEENLNSTRLLMAVLVLNNIKSSTTKQEQQRVSNTLQKCYSITDWIIKNVTLSLKNKQFLLNMTLELLVYLLKLSNNNDSLGIMESDKFLTQLTLTIFFMNCKTHSQHLAHLFELLLDNNSLHSREQLLELDKESFIKYKSRVQNKLIVLEKSFKFWQNIIKLLLNDEHILSTYAKTTTWVENLIFSLDFYLSSIEKLNKTIKHIEDHNDILKVDEESLSISKLSPDFKVIKNLVELLKRFGAVSGEDTHSKLRTYSNSHLTTLWSLVFETLACIEMMEKVNEERILEDMITTLLNSSIQLQEVTYLVQTSFRISPNAQFICTLLFQALNKSIGTMHEETVFTLCDKWLDVLLKKPEGEAETLEGVEVTVTFNNTMDIANIFEDTSNYLVKYLNYSYFGGVIGASAVAFKKANIISELFFINRATNDQGELILEKAFLEAKENEELRQKLERGFDNIVTWLFLSSGEHTGPIQKYVKSLETQCKFIIMVASDTKDCSLINQVIKIYNMLMHNIQELLQQGRIPLALAFSKSKTIHQILEMILEYLMVSDEIAKDFVFEKKGLDYFLDLLMSSKSEPDSKPVIVHDDEEEIITTSSRADHTNTVNLHKDHMGEDLLNDELFEYVSSKLKAEQDHHSVDAESKADDIPPVTVNLSRNVTGGDFVPNEFARTMVLVDSNIEKVKELVSNMDWSVNKKGYRQRLVYQKFGPEHNNEIWMLFKMNRVIEIKEIQIGFTNFWTVDSEVYIEPSSVIVEAGMTENETTSLCSLEKLDDKGFANFGSTVYGLNLYSFNKQSHSDNLSSLVQSNFSSLQSMKARYLKFKIRNNSITCLENSPLVNKYMKPKALGINFISIMGYDIHNVGNIDTTILDMKRSASSKILSILFRGDFSETLEKIAKDEYYINHIKENLNNLMELISDKKLSHVIGQILQMFVTYNKDLGDWIIAKLLDTDWGSTQVSLLYTLTKCNPLEFLGRLQIIKEFIFKQCAHVVSSSAIVADDLLRLEPFMKTFVDLVSIYSKQLQIESWCQLVFDDADSKEKLKTNKQEFINTKRAECLKVSFEDLSHSLKLLDESTHFEAKDKEKVTECLTKFILPFIIYGTIHNSSVDNTKISPKQVIEEHLIKEKENEFKVKLASIVVANLNSDDSDYIFDLIIKHVDISTIIDLLNEAENIETVQEERFVPHLEFWIN